MSCLLCIDTTTDLCSVTLSENLNILHHIYVKDKNVHSALLSVFVNECLEKSSLDVKDIKAVAVNAGPGSFTGLRIGVAFAKGFCYGSNIPLIGINSLHALANQIKSLCREGDAILPLIDAYNNETYYSLYDTNMNQLIDFECGIPEPELLAKKSGKNSFVSAGSGLRNLSASLLNDHRLRINKDIVTDSRHLIPFVIDRIKEGRYEDILHFEPYYLRDFKARNLSVRIKNVLNAPSNKKF